MSGPEYETIDIKQECLSVKGPPPPPCQYKVKHLQFDLGMMNEMTETIHRCI